MVVSTPPTILPSGKGRIRRVRAPDNKKKHNLLFVCKTKVEKEVSEVLTLRKELTF